MTGGIGGRLAATLGELAVQMQAQHGTTDTLRAIVDAAAHIVPGACWAGISMIRGRQVVAEVPTDPVVAKIDELQCELGDGPCLTALREHHTVHIDDMLTETRWLEFAGQATELVVRSLLSFQLFVRSKNFGALNFYAGEAGVFTGDSVEVGTILAQDAAVAMAGATAANHCQSALAGRDVIRRAKGILVVRNNLTGLQAFTMLTHASQETTSSLSTLPAGPVAEHENGVAPT